MNQSCVHAKEITQHSALICFCSQHDRKIRHGRPVTRGCEQKQASQTGPSVVRLGTSSNRCASAATFFMSRLHSLSSLPASKAQRVLNAASWPLSNSKNLSTSARQALCTVTCASRSSSIKNSDSFFARSHDFSGKQSSCSSELLNTLRLYNAA